MMKTHPGKVTCHALLRVSLYSIDFVALYMNVHCETLVKVIYLSTKVSPERGIESEKAKKCEKL